MPALSLLPDEVTQLSELLTQHIEPAQLRSIAKGRLDIDLDVLADGLTGVDIARALIEDCQKGQRSEQLLLLILQEMSPPPELFQWITSTCTPAAARSPNSPLHKLLHRSHPTQDYYVFLGRAQVRGQHICRIEIDARAEGTGLLIGPDQVLTAYHIVETLVSNGRQLPGSQDKLKFRFDYCRLSEGGPINKGVVVDAAANWLGPHLPQHPEDGHKLDPREPPACLDHLDYALLRLAQPIGNIARRESGGELRGWTELIDDPALVVLAPNAEIWIGHHPDGIPLQSTAGTIAAVNATRSRIRYVANATGGSSGAPCFNNQLDVVAMHHARINGFDFNQGIPITTIKQHIERCGLQFQPVSEDFAPVWKLANDHPVFGRDELQRCVWDAKAATNLCNVVTVTGAAGSGRSFCADILRAQLGASNLLLSYDFAQLSMRSLLALAELLATDLGLSRESIPAPSDDRQRSRWANTVVPNWFASEFQRRLERGAAEHNQVWIIVDNYERHEFVDDEARDFIVSLLRSPERLPRLRWLLLGRSLSAAVIEPDRFVNVEIDDVTREDGALYLERYCRAMNVTPRKDRIEAILDVVFSDPVEAPVAGALLAWRAKLIQKLQIMLVS